MKKSKIQLAIIITGVISLGLGIKTMLQTPTLILPAPLLVLMFTPILILTAFAIGFAINKASNLRWNTLTITSSIISIVCLLYFGLEHRPGHSIQIPNNYSGKVFLLESNKNDFNINDFGIGYINSRTMEKGFIPTVYKGKADITKQISGYAIGSQTVTLTGENKKIDYVHFEVPDVETKSISWKIVSLDDLIKTGAIDTNRVKTK